MLFHHVYSMSVVRSFLIVLLLTVVSSYSCSLDSFCICLVGDDAEEIVLPKNIPSNGTIPAAGKLTFVTPGLTDWRYVIWGVKLDV